MRAEASNGLRSHPTALRQIPPIPEDVWSFPFAEGLVLARSTLQGLFILNESASRLWSWTAQGSSYSQLVINLQNDYGIDALTAERDVNCTLSTWNATLCASLDKPAAISPRVSPSWLESSDEYFHLNNRIIRMRVSSPELLSEISPRLQSLESPPHGQPDLEFQIWTDGESVFLAESGHLIASQRNPNAIRAILLQEMVRRTEQGREWLAVLHAAACGIGNSCVLLAGKSNSGKTTLAAALMADGLTFYCDDSAAIGRNDYHVSPMPFRMMVRQGSWNVLQPHFPGISSFSVSERFGQMVRFLSPSAQQLATSPGAPKSLVFVSYTPGEKTSLRSLLPFEALLKLQESGFWVKHDRESIASFLEWLLSLPTFDFVYSNLDEAISEIEKLAVQ